MTGNNVTIYVANELYINLIWPVSYVNKKLDWFVVPLYLNFKLAYFRSITSYVIQMTDRQTNGFCKYFQGTVLLFCIPIPFSYLNLHIDLWTVSMEVQPYQYSFMPMISLFVYSYSLQTKHNSFSYFNNVCGNLHSYISCVYDHKNVAKFGKKQYLLIL